MNRRRSIHVAHPARPVWLRAFITGVLVLLSLALTGCGPSDDKGKGGGYVTQHSIVQTL